MEEKVKYIKTCENCDWDGVCPHSYKEYDLRRQNKQLQEENEGLRLTIKNDDTVVHNLIREKKQLQDKLDKIKEYIKPDDFGLFKETDFEYLQPVLLQIIESESE